MKEKRSTLEQSRFRGLPGTILDRAFAKIDIASLVFFRIAFGLLMIWMVARVWNRGLIAAWWINAHFHFKYAGFSWVEPWPGNGLYIHWIVLGVLALFIAVGFLYRISAALFCLSHTYFFLLDQGRYVNHTYLICLFSFLLIFVPAHRAFSIDVWLNPKLRSQTAPMWSLWLLRMQMAVVYFFAGIAKITPDWFQGEPMRFWLDRRAHFPVFDHFFHEEWAVYAASYGSLLLDLSLAPFLFWRRTRVPAFFAAVTFHLLNEWIFPLDIFPWLAIAATTLFLSPSWPRRVFSRRQSDELPTLIPKSPAFCAVATTSELPATWKQKLVLSFVTIYVAIQILVPLRNFLHRGGIEWTYMEHRFSWQMMLRVDAMATYIYVTDPNSGRTLEIRPRKYLDSQQMRRMGWRPDMVWQFVRFLGRSIPHLGPKPLQIETRMLVSINGRKPQLFLDPTVDLVAEPRPWARPRWLLQINDPLPPLEERLSSRPRPASTEDD